MATIDKTGCGPTNGVMTAAGMNKVYVMQNIVDLTAGAITQDDVYQCLAIPADTLVMHVAVEIITAAVGTTLTMNVGDGGSTAGWDTGVDGKGTAGTITHSAIGTDARAAAAGQGYFYDTADSIDILMATATAITAGPKLRVSALCVDFN